MMSGELELKGLQPGDRVWIRELDVTGSVEARRLHKSAQWFVYVIALDEEVEGRVVALVSREDVEPLALA
jgi:hypothetical protein